MRMLWIHCKGFYWTLVCIINDVKKYYCWCAVEARRHGIAVRGWVTTVIGMSRRRAGAGAGCGTGCVVTLPGHLWPLSPFLSGTHTSSICVDCWQVIVTQLNFFLHVTFRLMKSSRHTAVRWLHVQRYFHCLHYKNRFIPNEVQCS